MFSVSRFVIDKRSRFDCFHDLIVLYFQGPVSPLLLPTESNVQHLESPSGDEERRRPDVMLHDHEPHALRHLHNGRLLVHSEYNDDTSDFVLDRSQVMLDPIKGSPLTT